MFRSRSRMAAALTKKEFWRMYMRLPFFVQPGLKAAYFYTTGRGTYPSTWCVRTPLGIFELEANCIDDLLTIGECFGKLDYAVDPTAEVIIDAGANAGYSALYFLTHAPRAHVVCIEPDPSNLERLKKLVARNGFTERTTILECALGPHTDTVSFAREPTGRYGHVTGRAGDASPLDLIVLMRSINDVLGQALHEHGRVSVLKLDIEGLEEESLRSADPRLLAKVEVIYAETPQPAPDLPGMVKTRQGGVVRWQRTSLS